jgi:hypothetical protein
MREARHSHAPLILPALIERSVALSLQMGRPLTGHLGFRLSGSEAFCGIFTIEGCTRRLLKS